MIKIGGLRGYVNNNANLLLIIYVTLSIFSFYYYQIKKILKRAEEIGESIGTGLTRKRYPSEKNDKSKPKEDMPDWWISSSWVPLESDDDDDDNDRVDGDREIDDDEFYDDIIDDDNDNNDNDDNDNNNNNDGGNNNDGASSITISSTA